MREEYLKKLIAALAQKNTDEETSDDAKEFLTTIFEKITDDILAYVFSINEEIDMLYVEDMLMSNKYFHRYDDDLFGPVIDIFAKHLDINLIKLQTAHMLLQRAFIISDQISQLRTIRGMSRLFPGDIEYAPSEDAIENSQSPRASLSPR